MAVSFAYRLKLDNTCLKYFIAFSAILFLWECAKVIVVLRQGKSIRLLDECSKYSLQIYLFNGFILVVVRTVLCNFLGVQNAFVIVSSLLILNVAISILMCKYIIPFIPGVCTLCGLKRRRKK